MSQPNDLNATAQVLVQEVTGLAKRVELISGYSRKSRLLIYATILGLLLDLTLTVVCAFLFRTQNHINTQLRHNSVFAQKALESDCSYFKDVGELPINKLTTSTGLRLFADFRNAYVGHDCQAVLGKLAKADPREIPYLLPAAK